MQKKQTTYKPPTKYITQIITTIIVIISILIIGTPTYAATLPVRYSLKDTIPVTVENQGTTGGCWMLAMGTVFETNLRLRQGKTIETSARHMDYGTSQSFLNNERNLKGFEREVDSGGRGEIALAYLTNGMGPVLESEMPYSEIFEKIALSEVTNIKSKYKVDSWLQFPSIQKTITSENITYKNEEGEIYTTSKVQEIRNQIKNHIQTYGAIYTGLQVGTNWAKYFNPRTASYYCNQDEVPDHALIIIGWDDTYSKTNFKEGIQPKNNGAYIVQNSWGQDSSLINGAFYVSYEDVNVEKELYGILDIGTVEGKNIYQYDELGRNQYYEVKEGTEVGYGANIFTRTTTNTEYLTEISVSSFLEQGCELYVNPTGGQIQEQNLIKVATIDKMINGYQTVQINPPLELTSQQFAVLAKYTRINNQPIGIPTITRVEARRRNNRNI